MIQTWFHNFNSSFFSRIHSCLRLIEGRKKLGSNQGPSGSLIQCSVTWAVFEPRVLTWVGRVSNFIRTGRDLAADELGGVADAVRAVELRRRVRARPVHHQEPGSADRLRTVGHRNPVGPVAVDYHFFTNQDYILSQPRLVRYRDSAQKMTSLVPSSHARCTLFWVSWAIRKIQVHLTSSSEFHITMQAWFSLSSRLECLFLFWYGL